jgi:hypothetical protein
VFIFLTILLPPFSGRVELSKEKEMRKNDFSISEASKCFDGSPQNFPKGTFDSDASLLVPCVGFPYW